MSESIIKFFVLGRANKKSTKLPLVTNPSKLDTASSSSEAIKTQIDLVEYLVKHPADTYYIQAIGDSMIGLGIYDGDILIVDRSLTPKNEDIIIVFINDELTCKRLEFVNGLPYFIPNHSIYSSTPHQSTDYHIWGVVTHNIHALTD